MGLRCKSCDSINAKWVEAWEDYYCQECLDSIYDSLDEFEDFEEISELEEMYKADGYIAYYKTWENSLENSGVSISFRKPASFYEEYPWTNIEKISASFLIGAACLAQW